MSWYLRTAADHDTHRGELNPDGTVAAQCGIRFAPRPLPGGLALPGHPQDRDQICPECNGASAPGDVTTYTGDDRRRPPTTPHQRPAGHGRCAGLFAVNQKAKD